MNNFLDSIDILKKEKKIGLVLSSGAARGLSHIGVIKALKEEGFPIDLIAGTSIGALTGACFAKKGEIKEFEELVLKTDLMRLVKLADFNPALLFKGFVQGKNVKELLKTIIGDIKFSDLSIPLAVVASDVNTGEEIVIKEGSVIEAIRASISMPVVFTPVNFKNRFLIDGSIVNPVPVNVAREMGAKFVIVSNALQACAQRETAKTRKDQVIKEPELASNVFVKEGNEALRRFQTYIDALKKKIPPSLKDINVNTPGIFNVLIQAMYTMECEIARLKLEEADIVIRPNTARIGVLEFNRGKEAILEGYVAAKNIFSRGAKYEEKKI